MKSYFIPIYRDANGVIFRPEDPAPAIGRGVIDPDSTLRTNAKLLSIISGQTEGAVPRLNSDNYDYGNPIQTDATGRPQGTEGHYPHVYSVNPASIGTFSEYVASYSRAESDSQKDEHSDVQAKAPAESAENAPGGESNGGD